MGGRLEGSLSGDPTTLWRHRHPHVVPASSRRGTWEAQPSRARSGLAGLELTPRGQVGHSRALREQDCRMRIGPVSGPLGPSQPEEPWSCPSWPSAEWTLQLPRRWQGLELLQEGLQSHHGASRTAARPLSTEPGPGLLNLPVGAHRPTGFVHCPLPPEYPGPHGEEQSLQSRTLPPRLPSACSDQQPPAGPGHQSPPQNTYMRGRKEFTGQAYTESPERGAVSA